jgi:hypothetical protein
MLELGVITPQVQTELARLQQTNASAADTWAVLRRALEEHQGSMERLSQSTSGRISTLKGLWKGLRREVGEGAIPALDTAIEDLIATITKLRQGDQLARWGAQAKDALDTAWAAVKGLAKFVAENRELLKTLGMTYVGIQIINSATIAISTLKASVMLQVGAIQAAAAAKAQETAATVANTAATGANTAAKGANAAATGAAAAAATANAAAMATQTAAATKLQVALGLVGSALKLIGPAAVALSAVKIWEIWQAADAAADAAGRLAKMGAPGQGDTTGAGRRK